MIQACLFDLDGVICDTARYHFLAWKKTAALLDIDFSEEDNEHLKGVSRVKSLEIILEMGNKIIPERTFNNLLKQKNELYLSYIEHMSPAELFPGVRSFIQSLHHAGIKTALGSASKNAQIILDKLEINDLFDATVDGNHVKNTKPAPDVFLLGAKALEVNPEQCIVFEDAPAGVLAAKSAGMACVGFGTHETLPAADWWIKSFTDITIEQLKKAITL